MNKPERKTIRAKWHNYQNGCYFITICTKNKMHYFGKIYQQKMYFSSLGKKLEEIIGFTKEIRKDQYIEIPIFTIMPNHIHFIIVLNTHFELNQHHFSPQLRNISSIVRGIKSSLTGFAIKNNIEFAWQPRYYDRIIRSDTELCNIYDYIQNNVMNWENDVLF